MSSHVGEAGRAGDEVRSDAHVRVELRDGGGLDLEVRSKVETWYGEAIRTQVREVAAALGLESARIVVDDRGALPFTLAARVECAARRATGKELPSVLPEPLHHALPASPRDRMRRSRLYVPGDAPKMMINACLYGADGIILDLEDAVAPGDKDAARILVRNALRSIDFAGSERMVRINPGDLGLEDLAAVVPQSPNLLLLPKCESADTVRDLDAHVRRLQKEAGVEAPVWLMPILETALGIERAYEIAAASPNVVALTIGVEDYTADLGVERTPEGRESLYARMRLVNAARAAGVQAIDSVYADVGDVDGLRRSVREARALGFEGKGCIHPRQIPVVHEALAPTATQIDRATRIVRAFESAQAAGRGVVALGTKMIDPPVVQRAQKIVELAVALGRLRPDWREADGDPRGESEGGDA